MSDFRHIGNPQHPITRIKAAITFEHGEMLIPRFNKSAIFNHFMEQSIKRNLQPLERALVEEFIHFENLLPRWLKNPEDQSIWYYLDISLTKLSGLSQELNYKMETSDLRKELRQSLESGLQENVHLLEDLKPRLSQFFKDADLLDVSDKETRRAA